MKTIRNVNIHPLERIGSATIGGALLIRNARHLSPGKALLALNLLWRGGSGHSFLYQALGVSTADGSQELPGSLEITRAITIGKPANELYQLWRTPQTLAQILEGIAEVTEVSPGRTHWNLQVPPGRNAAWDTEIVEDWPGEFLRWESVSGSRLPHEGLIRFRPATGGRGTEVTLSIRLNPPGGSLGLAVAGCLGFLSPMVVGKILRNMKSLAETGEIPTLARNPAARPGDQMLSPPPFQEPSHVAAL
ncbi:SRPBCC family protein [Tengunoibacter tsumagoiensis]|uniref:Cyclase n=1 Tax=Tengunoibacter tsumagoiensis TaxID=2014871 RepID=A0A402A8C4_9CHLR|nr:SRPBCC family protein [Tengunoibacter tsumagoiensis]GCE15359.1 cyclase [Tengunoibacter tsumagoiensis]